MGNHGKPSAWVGHVVLESEQVEATAAFLAAVGLRAIFRGPTMAILELRGGTHLLVFPKGKVPGGASSFDLMVEDLVVFHERVSRLGHAPSDIVSVPEIHHERFSVREPGGNVLWFLSSHASGQPI